MAPSPFYDEPGFRPDLDIDKMLSPEVPEAKLREAYQKEQRRLAQKGPVREVEVPELENWYEVLNELYTKLADLDYDNRQEISEEIEDLRNRIYSYLK